MVRGAKKGNREEKRGGKGVLSFRLAGEAGT